MGQCTSVKMLLIEQMETVEETKDLKSWAALNVSIARLVPSRSARM